MNEVVVAVYNLRQPLKPLSKISGLPEFHLPLSGNL